MKRKDFEMMVTDFLYYRAIFGIILFIAAIVGLALSVFLAVVL